MFLAFFQKNEHSPVATELCGSTNTPKHRRDCGVFHGTIPRSATRCCGLEQPPWTESPFFGGVGTGACNGNRRGITEWSKSIKSALFRAYLLRLMAGGRATAKTQGAVDANTAEWSAAQRNVMKRYCGRSSPDECRVESVWRWGRGSVVTACPFSGLAGAMLTSGLWNGGFFSADWNSRTEQNERPEGDRFIALLFKFRFSFLNLNFL